jgi:hypothetical protein
MNFGNTEKFKTLVIYGSIGLAIFVTAICLIFLISKKYDQMRAESRRGNAQLRSLDLTGNRSRGQRNNNRGLGNDAVVEPLPLYEVNASNSNHITLDMQPPARPLSQPPVYKKFENDP